MFLKQIDLTTALRPAYLPDEVLLFVQDNVGLYEGKFKLPNQQSGQVYLTSHRICYVDKDEPRKHSVALDLKDVERYEFYAGFLKSSAKVTVIPKPTKRSSLHGRAPGGSPNPTSGRTSSPRHPQSPHLPPAAPAPTTSATWVCTICSFSNPVPSNFDPHAANAHTPLPPCLACGIKPTLSHVLKASISNASSRPQAPATPSSGPSLQIRHVRSSSRPENPGTQHHVPHGPAASQRDPSSSFQCPRCTFLNHPSLLSCELCGGPLISQDLPSSLRETRTQSPGPVLASSALATEVSDSIKISFRSGGDKIFYERLKISMTQRKWLLHGAPPIPKSNAGAEGLHGADSSGPGGSRDRRPKTVGIAALEQRGLDMRKNNELVIGSSFEDLEALMASAKEVVALAERFARQANGTGASSEANALLAESASQLGLVATKDIVGGGGSSETLYLSELSRNVVEYLTDDARGVLRKAGGIMSLVDLWAMFNRARGGVELVSPNDFEKATRMWEKLHLPVHLRTFKSGVLVVQSRDRTDETTIKALLSWLQDLHEFPPDRDVPWDWHQFGRGVTAQDAAERFGWSIGVAEEELEMAEEKGVVCREEGIEGLKFWKNHIDTGDVKPLVRARDDVDEMTRALKSAGLL